MIPIDSTNDQSMCVVIKDYIYTLAVKIRFKEKFETAWSSRLYYKHFRNLKVKESNLLGNECIVW